MRFNRCIASIIAAMVIVVSAGCHPGSKSMSNDPASEMIAQVDQAPLEKRPPNWEVTKALMTRHAPEVGSIAPDFTLTTADGKSTVTRSKFQADRPLVLVFGSFT
jgi:hypothetical protein